MQQRSTDRAWQARRREASAPQVAAGNPVILIIEAGEWTGRSLETALAPRGYAVRRAHSGGSGIAHARASNAAAILVDAQLQDMPATEVCRTLAADPIVGATTPILLVGASDGSRRSRLDGLLAGAWDFVAMPPDLEELTAKLAVLTRAKRKSDSMRAAGLLDEVTGLYNLRGMLRRAEELGAESARYERPLACIAFTIPAAPHAPGIAPETLAGACAELRAVVRASDVLGRIARAQFAVLAPETDSAGAQHLAERGLRALDRLSASRPPHGATAPIGAPRAGYCAVRSQEAAAVSPEELIGRTLSALQLNRPVDSGEGRVRQYRA
jgi:PleD family two-component response regulator